ncbi:hypothetical protein M0R45_007172 [Rubus argutus]|uniref:Uncharacterized protein n=1 Tax=Rubus argutus TaxID=59490 RepID=A0AAW1YSM9_RUBAR
MANWSRVCWTLVGWAGSSGPGWLKGATGPVWVRLLGLGQLILGRVCWTCCLGFRDQFGYACWAWANLSWAGSAGPAAWASGTSLGMPAGLRPTYPGPGLLDLLLGLQGPVAAKTALVAH